MYPPRSGFVRFQTWRSSLAGKDRSGLRVKISRDIQGLAAVSFLMPRLPLPLGAKRNHEEPSGAVIQIRKLDPRPRIATTLLKTCARTMSLTVL